MVEPEEQFDPDAFQAQLEASLGVVDQLVRSWLPPEPIQSAADNRRARAPLVGRMPKLARFGSTPVSL
jgi:hypothetical protein